MAYAKLEDVTKFLDDSKVVVTEDDDTHEQESAERIIRGYLAGHIDPVEIASWATPGTTPELIRDIAGRLVAAFRYRKLYSEDVNEVSPYAQNLYDEAISMLGNIVSGNLVIVSLVSDETVDVQGMGLNRDFFYPRDAQDDEPENARKFTMGMSF